MPKPRIEESPALKASRHVFEKGEKREKPSLAGSGANWPADAKLKNPNLRDSARAELQRIRNMLAINHDFVKNSLARKMRP